MIISYIGSQDIQEVIEKKMAKNKDADDINLLKRTYPFINVFKTNNDYETLEAVNSNKVDFAIEPLPVVAYYMSRYAALNNIFISRYTDMLFETNIAISKDNTMLYEIFNKTIKEIGKNIIS